jgi:hypothetical protein
MTDIGLYLVVAFAFLVPWLLRVLKAPGSLAWPIFAVAIVLWVLFLVDRLHVYVPDGIGKLLIFLLMLALLVRLALDLFPRDRASRP